VSTETSNSIVYKALASVHDPFVRLQSRTKYLWLLHWEANASILSQQLRQGICMLDMRWMLVKNDTYTGTMFSVIGSLLIMRDILYDSLVFESNNRSTCFCNGRNGTIIAKPTEARHYFPLKVSRWAFKHK